MNCESCQSYFLSNDINENPHEASLEDCLFPLQRCNVEITLALRQENGYADHFANMGESTKIYKSRNGNLNR